MKLTVVALCLSLVCSTMLIATAHGQDIASQFDRGRVVYKTQPVEREYRLALSGLKKVNNNWRVSREQKVHGVVERKTVELANTMTFAEAKRQLQAAMAQIDDATVAFACEGLDCGSSSGWANHVFDIKTLYGLDLYQYYAVLHVERGDETLHAAYYLIQRGSGRIYLQQDLVRSKANRADATLVTEADIEKQLADRGYWTIAGSESALQKMSQVEVELVAALMTKNRRWRIAVVGHNYEPVPLAEQRERSLLHAKIVEKQLLDAGINANRLQSYGLGSLAPAGKVAGGRVELVLIES